MDFFKLLFEITVCHEVRQHYFVRRKARIIQDFVTAFKNGCYTETLTPGEGRILFRLNEFDFGKKEPAEFGYLIFRINRTKLLTSDIELYHEFEYLFNKQYLI